LPPNPAHWPDARNMPYLDALAGLQVGMQMLGEGERCSSDASANSRAMEQADKAEAIVNQLARNFDGTGGEGAVTALLESPIKDARHWIANPEVQAKRGVESALRTFCATFAGLSRRYPFNRKAEDDSSPEEVAKVFAPQNSSLATLRQALADNILKSGAEWVAKPDATVKLLPGFLRFFNQASAISDTLFQGGSPGMHYKLLVQPNPGVKQVTGAIGGVELSTAGKEFSWPQATAEINLRVIPSDGGNSALRRFTGPWAIFRLLSSADKNFGHQFQMIYLQGGGGNSQPILTDGSPIVLEVTQFPNGNEKMFDSNFFPISCPGRATD